MKRAKLAEEFIAQQWINACLENSFRNPNGPCLDYDSWFYRLCLNIFYDLIDADTWGPLPDRAKNELLYLAEENISLGTYYPVPPKRDVRCKVKKTFRTALSWIKSRF